jgi:hypothetical protein
VTIQLIISGPKRMPDGRWKATYRSEEDGVDGGWGRCIRKDQAEVVEWVGEILARYLMNPHVIISREAEEVAECT